MNHKCPFELPEVYNNKDIWNYIKFVLTEEEYKLIEDRYVKFRTKKELGKELGYSPYKMTEKYNEIFDKLKKFMIKDDIVEPTEFKGGKCEDDDE